MTGNEFQSINDLIWLVLCHLIGDYVLQSDYIAKTKGENWYHLFVHSALYCVPFMIVFESMGLLAVFCRLFCTHFVIDAWKSRYRKINYADDQCLHYGVLLVILLKGWCYS